MLLQREGTFGKYWGDTFDSSTALSLEQMNVNAKYIFSYLTNKGWSLNAIAGTLGNMQVESTLNPGRWQNDEPGKTSMGYGLVQWTPSTNYTSWVSGDSSTMDNNLSRIIYELENNLQYIPTEAYPETFEEFTKSTKSPSYLAMAFLKNYERAGVEASEVRQTNANRWYKYLGGESPIDPGGPGGEKDRKKFNFILFNKRRRGIYG